MVTNSTVDGVLAAFFAVLIIIVMLDAARIWLKAIVSKRRLQTTEVPAVESTLWAPSGLIPTAEEREYMANQRTRGRRRRWTPTASRSGPGARE